MRLQEAGFDMTAGAFTKANEADKKLLVQFGMYPHEDTMASEKEGRPIFTDKLYIMIMVPGDKESIVHRPAWDKDFQRFPEQYAAFKNKQNQNVASGTPLRLATWITLAQTKELEYFNVYTLEQLASMPDSQAHKFQGIQKLKQLANDFLVAAKEAAPLTAIRAELDKKDSQLEAANRQLAELNKRLEALEAEAEA